MCQWRCSRRIQRNYITNYYANIYRKVPGEVRPYRGCIEDFLGPEIVGRQDVSRRKIPDLLKNDYEQHLSKEELDAAVVAMRNKSAGGPDGLSVNFVKRYWHFFRDPLCKYASYCVQNGTLTDSFKCVAIKLIPKKGDLSCIKNWRPISLLNVLYKVISKALNNRLKKVAPFVISRSQKGFIDKKFIQECLINIGNSISYAERFKVPAFALALDLAKAFDSVDHGFMTEVYRFCGFGENFIGMLNLFTTDRHAHIAFDDGVRGSNFPLECGNAQGNPPVPDSI
jgi:hypothetical protein